MSQPAGGARSEILSRIRRALDDEEKPYPEIDAALKRLPRAYDRTRDLPDKAVIDLFIERLLDYDAHVERCESHEVAAAVARLLESRSHPAMLVAAGFAPSWLPQTGNFSIAEEASFREIGEFGGVLTEATLGIAETGTFVLQSVAGQGSRAQTLLPDYHLCVLRETDIVQRVPQAFDRLQATATLPMTFVSGPSATADIEMTRIKGVHGPRFLDVLLVR